MLISNMHLFVDLYRYGGIYLDSDIIVLGSLSSLNNSVGKEGQLAGDSLNGAVMAFRRHRYKWHVILYFGKFPFTLVILFLTWYSFIGRK